MSLKSLSGGFENWSEHKAGLFNKGCWMMKGGKRIPLCNGGKGLNKGKSALNLHGLMEKHGAFATVKEAGGGVIKTARMGTGKSFEAIRALAKQHGMSSTVASIVKRV